MRSHILTLDRWLTGASFTIATALLAIISCLGLWQVTTRFVLSQPSVWTEEVMRRLLIWCVMLGVVVAIRQGALISVDLALRLTRGAWRQALRLFVALATFSFLATILWFGISLAWRVRFQSFASLDISIAWAYAAVPFGAALGMVAVVAHYLDPPAPTPMSADNTFSE
jgi:TRAP-type C4-dicarboxylate transport system permease small subunit